MNIRTIYFAVIALSPIVDGVLKVRLGAGWELSVIGAIVLFLLSLKSYSTSKHMQPVFTFLTLAFILLLISDLFGLAFYSSTVVLTSEQLEQINSVAARMFTESIRFLMSVFIFLFTYYYLKTTERIDTALMVFLFSALLEGLYGLYEFIVKIFGLTGVFPLLRGSGGNIQSLLRVYGTFFEPSNYGQFMAFALFLYIGYVLLSKRGVINGGYLTRRSWIVSAIFIAAILVSLSRTAFLAIAVAIVIKILSDVISLRYRRVLSAFRFSIAVACILIVCVTIIVLNVSDDFLNLWIYHTFNFEPEINYENTSISRATSLFEQVYNAILLIAKYPLGIGQGMAFLENPFSPFIVRLPLETGLVFFLAFFSIITILIYRAFFMDVLAYYFLPSAVILLVSIVNYNSTNHIWIWFSLAILLRLSHLRLSHSRNLISTNSEQGS